MTLRVEVFPVEVRRWIAVIEGPTGRFSTEAERPEQVSQAVNQAIHNVLGRLPTAIDFVDDLGEPWTSASADEQRRRLEIAAG